jgi:hypothetical protein
MPEVKSMPNWTLRMWLALLVFGCLFGGLCGLVGFGCLLCFVQRQGFRRKVWHRVKAFSHGPTRPGQMRLNCFSLCLKCSHRHINGFGGVECRPTFLLTEAIGIYSGIALFGSTSSYWSEKEWDVWFCHYEFSCIYGHHGFCSARPHSFMIGSIWWVEIVFTNIFFCSHTPDVGNA